MAEKVDTLLTLLRQEEATAWVADQVVQSFSHGVSMNVKEAAVDLRFSVLEPAGLSVREKQKREKYETTRQYSDPEKLQLIRNAMRSLFVELPAIQAAAITRLHELGSSATDVEFVPPDEPEQGRSAYSKALDQVEADREVLVTNFSKFEGLLIS